MRSKIWHRSTLFTLLAGLALWMTSCGQKDPQERQVSDKDGKKKDDHSQWWCQAHGIPEHLCSLCDDAVAAKLKKEGDWCKLHDRAKSQCFKCDPSLYKRFEDMYVAKYNKKPEPPPKSEFEK